MKDALDISLDMTRLLLTIAFAGIGVIVGLSQTNCSASYFCFCWIAVLVFAISAVSGIVYIMCAIFQLGSNNSCNVFDKRLTFLSKTQIYLLLGGIAILCIALWLGGAHHTPQPRTILLKTDNGQSVAYPVQEEKNIVIEFDQGKIRFETIP